MAEPKRGGMSGPRRAQLLIAGITVAALAVVGVSTVMTWPETPVAEAANIPSENFDPWSTNREFNETSFAWEWEKDMNEGLATGDKELFLANSSGQGREALERWWDGTRAIGWTYAYAYKGGDNTLNLGMQLGFVSHPLMHSGSLDAGLDLTQMFSYTMAFEGEYDDAVIVGLEAENPMPWDEGEVYVAKRDHAVVYGAADERALIDEYADLTEESATLSLETLAAIGGSAPTEGFNVIFTDDAGRFDRWSGLTQSDMEMHVAGVAASTSRPSSLNEFMPPTTAVGPYSSGSWIVMGPLSANGRQAVLVHEMGHVLQEAALPYNGYSYFSPAPVEGFATYFAYAAGVTAPPIERANARGRVLAEGGSAMSDEAVRDADSNSGYGAAGSFFQYVAENGGSAWQLAMDRDNALSVVFAARQQSTEFSEQGWVDWVARQ